MNTKITISVIIPHYNGRDILAECLHSISKNSYPYYEVIIVDNGSTDGSQHMVYEKYPWTILLENNKNIGYAGGCNLGMKIARGAYFLLLNNDTILSPNTLDALLKKMKTDKHIGLVQPKIRSIQQKSFFDYSGGAGGEIDMFGYPFTRGRLFDKIESDKGQYDVFNSRIFWASGTCCMIRKEVIEKIDNLDESFFAHMEEIDLNWRAHLFGYTSAVTYDTLIYHYSGYTLKATNLKKMYLNHRNNMIMLIKNYSAKRLSWILPLRLGLECMNLVYALITGNIKWVLAIIGSFYYLATQMPKIIKKRLIIQRNRTVDDRVISSYMYRPSIVWAYFVQRKQSLDLLKKMYKK